MMPRLLVAAALAAATGCTASNQGDGEAGAPDAGTSSVALDESGRLCLDANTTTDLTVDIVGYAVDPD